MTPDPRMDAVVRFGDLRAVLEAMNQGPFAHPELRLCEVGIRELDRIAASRAVAEQGKPSGVDGDYQKGWRDGIEAERARVARREQMEPSGVEAAVEALTVALNGRWGHETPDWMQAIIAAANDLRRAYDAARTNTAGGCPGCGGSGVRDSGGACKGDMVDCWDCHGTGKGTNTAGGTAP